MNDAVTIETDEEKKSRIAQILAILKKTYPDAKIALKYSNDWELLVATILSAQCTDKKVNEVTDKLFQKYKTLDDYCRAELRDFEQDVKSTGFFRNKAKAILFDAHTIKNRYNGHVPNRMTHLTNLPGVARKTANIVLGNAFGIVEGIAVDTHVQRLSQRLRLVNMDTIAGKKTEVFMREGKEVVDYTKEADPNKIEKELMQVIPKEDWFKFTYMVIDHGRAICKAQNPDCPNCPLKDLCPASRV